MEKKPPEFENYLSVLEAELHVNASLKKDICNEILQSLYDKYNELLIKGYGLDAGITETLKNFEDPGELAEMFNRIHGGRIEIHGAAALLCKRNLLLAALLTVVFILTTV